MPSLASEEQWKDRYREVVRELEDKERAWKAREVALRSTAGKLALAAMGQSPELDVAVDRSTSTSSWVDCRSSSWRSIEVPRMP